MASTNTATAGKSVLDRAQAKQAVLDDLYAKIGPPDPGSTHRPLTAAERKLQKDNALSVAELRALQSDLWGQWRAVDNIEIDGVLAFAAGAAVPTTHVDRFDLQAQGLVERVTPVEQPAADKGSGNG